MKPKNKKTSVLGLAGSPVKCGNTDLLLDSFLEGARKAGAKTEKIYVCDLRITPCNNNQDCKKTGICTVKDDMQGIYPKLRTYDIIVISSPIYFMGLPSQLKSLIDRCQVIWVEKYILKKHKTNINRKGFFISTGGGDYNDLFTGAENTVKSLFISLGIPYKGSLLFPNMDSDDAITRDLKAQNLAYEKGFKLVLS